MRRRLRTSRKASNCCAEADVVVNTQALAVADRPAFFANFISKLRHCARTGRPHWLLIDEAHQILAAERDDAAQTLPEKIRATIYITVHPDALSSAALQGVEIVLALGGGAPQALATFCDRIGIVVPRSVPTPGQEEVLFWARTSGASPVLLKPVLPLQARRRHARKYAEGELGEDVSFYFRGPEGKLNLRAQNLTLFTQIAEGVDEVTWEYHRQAGEYSAWFRNVIKDQDLAQEAAAIEADASLSPAESRQRIVKAVTKRYTAPARAQNRS
jgi:hypothetical protein